MHAYPLRQHGALGVVGRVIDVAVGGEEHLLLRALVGEHLDLVHDGLLGGDLHVREVELAAPVDGVGRVLRLALLLPALEVLDAHGVEVELCVFV